jgi:hypothetical protein
MYQHFRGHYFINLEVRRNASFILKMEAAGFSET